jgi:hypothetical protein
MGVHHDMLILVYRKHLRIITVVYGVMTVLLWLNESPR